MKKKLSQKEPVPEFNWGEISDHSRIASNTERYKDMGIAEAFADFYKIKGLKKSKIKSLAPPVFNVGEYVNLTVKSLDKKHVIFDQTNFKEEIKCTVNLSQYPKFKDFSEPIEIMCRVVSKTDNSVLVDPIYWFYDQFLTSYVQNTDYQYNIQERFKPFTAKNLKLVRGGFMGSLRLDNASDFFGKDIFLDVFIPGSQIVVNVEKDFNRWVGQDVPFYIINLIEKPGTDNKVVVGSPKEYYRLNSRIDLIDTFNHYCMDDDIWRELVKKELDGVVTGVVHTASKCGIFVEADGQTGMIECTPDEILKYKAGQMIKVKYSGFNELKKYNPMVDQYQHIEAYTVEKGILKKFNLKVTFVLI
jgi:ribosomal protein S1